MTTGTSIKDRCRLCYTRLKDASSLHHKICSSQQTNRIYNIYKRRPFRYRDLIVRYLSINLPENNNPNDQYSTIICGTCATSLIELETTYRSYEQTQKNLRSKFRKTSHIVRYQIDKQMKNNTISIQKPNEEPKRLSKRKGAPKHINQHSKTNGQLFFKLHHDDDDADESIDSLTSQANQRTNSKNKHDILTETTNQKKKLRTSESTSMTSETSNNDCINLLKPSTLTDISTSSLPTSGSHTSSNSRSTNSVKGNHIERIAVSLLSGTENLSDDTNGHSSDLNSSKTRSSRRKLASSTALDTITTNNILSSTVATILSPSFDDDDNISNDGDLSNDSCSNLSGNKVNSSSNISTTPTAEGLAITAINPTGQKQVFMAQQIGNLKKYRCVLCEKVVTNIQIHVRRHTNDKPYPCTYCEKRFTNSGDLQIHVRIHTGEKPYACPLCLKSYRTIGNFNSHVKTHDSGVRPHRCELCNQTFPIPKDWYSHLRSSHRSRTNNTSSASSSSLNSTNATTTVTQPLFSNALTSQQQHNEIFVPNKVKLEPINRSQLIIKSSKHDVQEPVNMTKKENSDESETDDDDEEENHHQTTQNLLSNVSTLKA